MKILKTLAIATVAATTLFVSSCKKDEKDPNKQTDLVQYEKKHDTALLLVTFGSTFDDPHATYKKQIAQFQEAFPDADIFFSFTSRTCINRWQAAKNEQFITPDLWFKSFLDKEYKTVWVQSLHVVPGEEYMVLRDGYVKPHYNFPAEELNREPAKLGRPLLVAPEDINEVAHFLVDQFASQLKAGEAVAFMGHGNPVKDYDHANASYKMIEDEMKAYGKKAYNNDNIFVGTVDYPQMLVDYVIEQLKHSSAKVKKVHLHPLMSIAGDHANNDMSSPDTKENGKDIPLEEQSWRNQIAAIGWDVECHIKGLGDYPEINKIWIKHLRQAISEKAE